MAPRLALSSPSMPRKGFINPSRRSYIGVEVCSGLTLGP